MAKAGPVRNAKNLWFYNRSLFVLKVKLHEYYAIIGRPRFGRSKDTFDNDKQPLSEINVFLETIESSHDNNERDKGQILAKLVSRLVFDKIDSIDHRDGSVSIDELEKFIVKLVRSWDKQYCIRYCGQKRCANDVF